MSVVGVDFGTLNTVIAVARNRGVDVVSIPPSPASPRSRFELPRPPLRDGLDADHGPRACVQISNEVSNRATP